MISVFPCGGSEIFLREQAERLRERRLKSERGRCEKQSVPPRGRWKSS